MYIEVIALTSVVFLAYKSIQSCMSNKKTTSNFNLPSINAEILDLKNGNYIILPRFFNPRNLKIKIKGQLESKCKIEIPIYQSELDSYLVLAPFIPKDYGFEKLYAKIENSNHEKKFLDIDIEKIFSLGDILDQYDQENKPKIAEAYD